MGCSGSKAPEPVLVVTAPAAAAPAAAVAPPEKIFRLKHCGVRAVNGWYLRAGEANGAPKYRHEDGGIWVRLNLKRTHWVVVPKDGSGCNCILYKVKLDKQSPTLPPMAGWLLGENYDAAGAAAAGWRDGYREACSKGSRWPAPNAPVSLTAWKEHLADEQGEVEFSGAGCAAVNGTYVRDGAANGAPKFRHAARPLWLRHSKTQQTWTVAVKDGGASWICLYSAKVDPAAPHAPPADGWRLGKNWSAERAAEDGWAEGFAAVATREPPPRVVFAAVGSWALAAAAGLPRGPTAAAAGRVTADGPAAGAPPVVVAGTIVPCAAAAASDLAADVAPSEVVVGMRAAPPPLPQMAALLRRELDLDESCPLVEVVRRAAAELGIAADARDATLLAQAEACYRLLLPSD